MTLQTTDNKRDSFTTIRRLFRNLEQENSAAANLVRLCAFLYKEDMPEELFKQGVRNLGGIFEPLSSPSVLDNALERACRFGFLRYEPSKEFFVTNSRLQDFLKQDMSDSERTYAGLTVRAVNHVFPDEFKSEADLDQKTRLMSSAFSCVTLIEQWDFGFEEAAQFLDKMGRYQYEMGEEAYAEPLFERALGIREKLLGKDNLYVADSLTHLARAYQSQSKYEQAKPLYERALAIREKALGKQHAKVAENLSDLASWYHGRGSYAEAKPFYEQALQTFEQVQGSWHPDVVNSLSNLACLYCDMKAYEKAKPLYEIALQIVEQVNGKQNPEIVPALNHLAKLEEAQGRYAHALPFYNRALEILENSFGKRSPKLFNGINNIAHIYEQLGVYDYAESLYQHALFLLENAYGKSCTYRTDSLNHLAVLYEKQGQYEQALQWYEKALDFLKFEQETPEFSMCSENYAALLSKMKGNVERCVVEN
jgi:tetratricopeptide (TPR) repeat protein